MMLNDDSFGESRLPNIIVGDYSNPRTGNHGIPINQAVNDKVVPFVALYSRLTVDITSINQP